MKKKQSMEKVDAMSCEETMENRSIFPHAPVTAASGVVHHNLSVSGMLEHVIGAARTATCETTLEDAFYVLDVHQIERQHELWRTYLPSVTPFYAVKCNPHPDVLRTMNYLGTGFDCASPLECDLVLQMGVHPRRIVFANACKQRSHLHYAKKHGIAAMTFDNMDELIKIAAVYPEAQLILRLLVDDTKSICVLGNKFGADPDRQTCLLLKGAKALGLNVIGISFHVGSGCMDVRAYDSAIARADQVFQQASSVGFDLHLLDIGGGFPGTRHDHSGSPSFEALSRNILSSLASFSESHANCRIIAEPGRFYVASAFTLAANVLARRVVADASPPSMMYYLNDGVYGSFNCLVYDHATVTPRVLAQTSHADAVRRFGQSFTPAQLARLHADPEVLAMMQHHAWVPTSESEDLQGPRPCSLWGPTCDGFDCIMKKAVLPVLHVGDWIGFDNMGAYTLCAASMFNGFPVPRVYVTHSESMKSQRR